MPLAFRSGRPGPHLVWVPIRPRPGLPCLLLQHPCHPPSRDRWSQLLPALSQSWLHRCVLTGNVKSHFFAPDSGQQKTKWGCLLVPSLPPWPSWLENSHTRQLGKPPGLPFPGIYSSAPLLILSPQTGGISSSLSCANCGGGNIKSSHRCLFS